MQSVARRITSGDIPFPYKRRFTDPAHPAAWFADLRGLPCALDVVAGARYALHGFLDRGRSVVVRVAAYAPAAAGSSGGAITVRRARIAADGPLRLDLSATSPLGGAAPSTSLPPPPPPPLSVTSFAGCGPVRKPFDRAFNERGGLLVDFYSEPARMRARRRDQALAPVDAWREPPAALAIAAKALRKFRAVTDDSLRHGQYGVLNGAPGGWGAGQDLRFKGRTGELTPPHYPPCLWWCSVQPLPREPGAGAVRPVLRAPRPRPVRG